MDKKKEKRAPNRRCGFSRRSYTYAHHIPERRSGRDRRDPNDDQCDQEPADELICESNGRETFAEEAPSAAKSTS